MEIIREFKRPMSRRVVVDIPEQYVDTELEILIIPVYKEVRKPSMDKNALFEKLCGLWEGRDDVTLNSIRDKAWKRNSY